MQTTTSGFCSFVFLFFLPFVVLAMMGRWGGSRNTYAGSILIISAGVPSALAVGVS